MPIRETDARVVTLVDIPLVKRLAVKGIVLDTELSLTRDTRGPSSALLSSLLLPQRGLYTLIVRDDRQPVVGQFRFKSEDANAQMVYLAPTLDPDQDDTLWLHLLDAMSREAGRHGAHCLTAEVDEDSTLFETMRTGGFAIYARQEIWRHPAGEFPAPNNPLQLKPETPEDAMGIQALFCATVPSLIQQVAALPSDARGLVYHRAGHVEGYMMVSEGKHGIYLTPYMHPEIMSDAAAFVLSAINYLPNAAKVPVYIRIRRYQAWLESTLYNLEFVASTPQAVMVRHIAAGVRHTSFAPLHRTLEAVPSPARPPSKY